MAALISGLPHWEVEFDQAGSIVSDDGLVAGLAESGVRDLFVFSHGWNNSFAGARSLYRDMFTMVAGMLRPKQRATTGFLGVLWPSLLFPEDGPADDGSPALLLASPADNRVADHSSGAQLAAALAPAFPGQEQQVHRLGDLLDVRPQDGAALDEFHLLATGLVSTPNTGGPEDNGERAAMAADPRTAITEMATAPGAPRGDTQGIDFFTKMWHGARELLRTMSYYEMKNRAGVVGRAGLGPLLGRLRERNPQLRTHLLGHSFGARLAAFSLDGMPAGAAGQSSPVKSLLLIQGAFSHFTFSPSKPGALAAVANRVDGPLLATFSVHDRAVGLWYPNASRLARQNNQALDDFSYEWGGMGHDGYQHDGVIPLTLGAEGSRYQFQKGRFYRLDSNAVICKSLSRFSEAHSDIRHPEVAWAAVSAAGLIG
jgi:hypothetical protein